MALPLLIVVISCKEVKKDTENQARPTVEKIEKDSILAKKVLKDKANPLPIALETLADTSFIRLADYSGGFAYDMRYATDNR